MLGGLSWIYSKITNARNSLYESGRLKSVQLPAPTISIGNITVGGTGKTPIVAWIAEYLAAKGENVCIISRGYKRNDESKRVLVSDKRQLLAGVGDAGDEPFELAKRLIGKAYVMADKDRVAAGVSAYEEFGITVFLLDDAFQHRRVGRDLDIIAIDSTNPFGNLKTLPSGVLREPLNNISRADLAILTRSNLNSGVGVLQDELARRVPQLPVVRCENVISDYRLLSDYLDDLPVSQENPKSVLAFCGIGNPDNFFTQLRRSGVDVVHAIPFADHHAYAAKDAQIICKAANEVEADAIITTAKDAVKLEGLEFDLPILVCETSLSFNNKKGLTDLIDQAISQFVSV